MTDTHIQRACTWDFDCPAAEDVHSRGCFRVALEEGYEAMSCDAYDHRGMAVAMVDGKMGYTVEFSNQPEWHAQEYDRVEDHLRGLAGLPLLYSTPEPDPEPEPSKPAKKVAAKKAKRP